MYALCRAKILDTDTGNFDSISIDYLRSAAEGNGVAPTMTEALKGDPEKLRHLTDMVNGLKIVPPSPATL
jgi:hypothetical protein